MEDVRYPLCKMYPKTMGHALWNYMAAQDVWSIKCVGVQKMSFQSNDFTEI